MKKRIKNKIKKRERGMMEEIMKKKSVALVRKRIIPTERPPLLGEVSAKFCGWRVSRGQRNGSPQTGAATISSK
jgi:hypothetical protein